MSADGVDKVVIVGLGLIGGSLARALQQAGFCKQLVGYGHREQSLRAGVELGVIDSYSLDLDVALEGADIVVLATPTLVANDLLQQVLPRLGDKAVLTDVASVKGSLLAAAREANGGVTPPQLVLAHPIAGSEQSGVAASRVDLFVDHRVILTPTEETDRAALALVRRMWQCTGAEVVDLGVAEHDAILAATSHLPHVLAYCLVDALASSTASDDVFRFAAGGFRDFTRIASSDPQMWRDIALANREEILHAMDHFSAHLATLRRAIEQQDGARLQDIFTAAKTTRDTLLVAAPLKASD